MRKFFIFNFLIIISMFAKDYYQIQWIDTLDFGYSDGGYDIVVYKENAIYVTGLADLSPGFGGGNYLTVKYDSLGIIQRIDTLDNGGYEWAMGIAVDSEGNVYVTGRSDFSGKSGDYLTVKYNSDLEIQRLDTFGFDSLDWAKDIAVDRAGNIYITGCSEMVSHGLDYLTIKYNSLGTIQWIETLDNGNTDNAYGIAVDQEGNIYVTGESQIGSSWDMLTVKYDSFGIIQRIDTIDNGHCDGGCGIVVDGQGNVYVAGYSEVGSGEENIYTVKYNHFDTIQWADNMGISICNHAEDIDIDRAGNVYVTGNFGDCLNQSSFITIKYDSNGEIVWMDELNIDSTDFSYGIAVDSKENIYVTGHSTIGGNYDFITVKYLKTVGIDSAIAFDRVIQEAEVDEDDYVILYFSEETNKPVIDNSTINSIFFLSSAHSWLDGSGNIENTVWNAEGTELTINLSTVSSTPTIVVGDTITPDGITIENQRGGICSSPVVLLGSFGESGVGGTGKIIELNVPSVNAGSISFSYNVTGNEPFSIKIYSIEGRLVRQINKENGGSYQNTITNLVSGIYLFELKRVNDILKKKTVLLK